MGTFILKLVFLHSITSNCVNKNRRTVKCNLFLVFFSECIIWFSMVSVCLPHFFFCVNCCYSITICCILFLHMKYIQMTDENSVLISYLLAIVRDFNPSVVGYIVVSSSNVAIQTIFNPKPFDSEFQLHIFKPNVSCVYYYLHTVCVNMYNSDILHFMNEFFFTRFFCDKSANGVFFSCHGNSSKTSNKQKKKNEKSSSIAYRLSVVFVVLYIIQFLHWIILLFFLYFLLQSTQDVVVVVTIFIIKSN